MSKGNVLVIQVLNTQVFSFEKLSKFLSGDKRKAERDIQKLISINQSAFDFLGIEARGIYDTNGLIYNLHLTSSKYAGIVPLRSADNGLIVGYLMVNGRYGEDFEGLLPIIDSDHFSPEFEVNLPLAREMSIHAPKYIECAKYIDTFIQAERVKWRKFSRRNEVQNLPANTDWEKYSLNAHDPRKALKYPNDLNNLTTEHPEWKQLQYVLSIAIKEILYPNTPLSFRNQYRRKINRLNQRYDFQEAIETNQMNIHASDPVIIKDLKTIGNHILNVSSETKYAWRIDYSIFFERYVQHIFSEVANTSGAKLLQNPTYPVFGHKPAWALTRLEPDLVMLKNDEQVIIDAKYKSHMYNYESNSENLKTTFRDDFHQVLAYTSFQEKNKKVAFLIYPYSSFKNYKTITESRISNTQTIVHLLGVPISRESLLETVQELKKISEKIETELEENFN